jgi:Rps23 Pro-64 3,4-dihydroxylase Tpa1-like proline 4-hydroxylase
MSNPDKTPKADSLLKHLNLVNQFAQSGYWITTDELCMLLSFDSSELEILNSKEILHRFDWRNFSCTQVACQGITKMWEISGNTYKKAELPKSLDAFASDRLHPSSVPSLISPVTKQEGETIAAEFAWVENFLTAAQAQRLLQYVQEQERNFVSTTNSANDANYRRSMVLYAFPEFAELMTKRINEITPFILTYLRLDSFSPSKIEIQLTLHNDGNYYKIHNDNGSPDCANRVLTFVYYFYREPKQFSGGELVLYDSKVENNCYVAATTFKTVKPQNNSIVFFPSYYMHEVLPVSCPSQAFLDSRFTLNGWIRN